MVAYKAGIGPKVTASHTCSLGSALTIGQVRPHIIKDTSHLTRVKELTGGGCHRVIGPFTRTRGTPWECNMMLILDYSIGTDDELLKKSTMR